MDVSSDVKMGVRFGISDETNDPAEYRKRLSDVLDTAFENSGRNKKSLDADFEKFNSIVTDINFKRNYNDLRLDTSTNEKGITLMQQASRIPDGRFVGGLLAEKTINPNIFNENDERPVLIAASLGNYKVLQEFKRYNKEQDVMSGKRPPVDFAVWTKTNEDTVLHLILTQKKLHEQLSKGEENIDKNEPTRKKWIKDAIDLKMKDYIRSIDVLVNDTCDDHLRQLKRIVNRENKQPGKTALHLAVDSWPQAIIKSLLNLGADVSKTYKNLKPILTQISVETISDYLSESCMSVEGFEEETDDEYDSDEEEDEIQQFRKDITECSPVFMDKVRESPVTFNFRFLLPSKSLSQMSSGNTRWNRKASIKRLELEPFLDPADLDQKYDDTKRKTDFVKSPIPEMQILECIADSKKHKALLTHPAIKSFVHLKWKKISPLFENSLKFNLIFVYCITWYIMTQFGGLEFNSSGFGRCRDGIGFESIIRNNTGMKEFCNAIDNLKPLNSSENRENFYRKFRLQGFADNENRSWNERIQFNLAKIFSKNQSEEYGDQVDISCNYYSNWYIGFAILAFVPICLEFIDLIKQLVKIGERVKQQKEDGKPSWLKTLLDIPGTILFICTVLPVLVGSKDLLWLTIFMFIIRSSFIEIMQFITCTFQGYMMRYIRSSSNICEITIVVLTILIVFIPNKYFEDPLNFVPSAHVKLLCGTSHQLVDNHNGTATGIGFGEDVTTKRKLSAFLIILSWGHTLILMSIHPMFQRFRFYMVMFKRVARRFAILLTFYSLFVIAFALGFYIMFHNDVGDSILEIKADEFTAFDSPTRSVFKILAMSLGEIEFDSMPIGISSGRKDGLTSELLACVFLASFMFIIVLVLNNLLNGLAVSDTEKIINDALIHQTEMYINILSYSDIMLHSYTQFVQFLFANFPSMKPLLYIFDAKSYLMIDDIEGRREVVMEIEEYESGNKVTYLLRKIQSLLSWNVSEIKRKNVIIEEAKQIIIDKKKAQIQERLFLKNEKIKELDFIKKIVSTLHNMKRDSTTEEFSY